MKKNVLFTLISCISAGAMFLTGCEKNTSTSGQVVPGEKGEPGNDGRGIVSIELVSSNGNVDTYSITYSDNTVQTYTVTNGLNGEPGAEGKTAYQLAVENGFEGTEAEWLESLKGSNGDPGATGLQGPAGQNGSNGENGKSAYEIALENGFEGTETEWLESLKGSDGSNGVQGPQGPQGAAGSNGTNGENGKSAYELAVEHGFDGSEEDWLESLKGADGTNGSQGPQGLTGATGPQGPQGASGTNGTNGTDGISIVDTQINSDGDLIVTLSSGDTINAGHLVDNDVFTVSFVYNNGQSNSYQEVVSGSKVNKPSDPEKEGYRFLGWFLGDEKWSFDGYVVTGNITLEAKWEEYYTEGLEFYLIEETHSYGVKMGTTKYMNDVVIPSTYNNLPVTVIFPEAFLDASIKTIVLPTTLKEIGEKAFSGCADLESINLGDTQVETIGLKSFDGVTKLESFDVPGTCKYLYKTGGTYAKASLDLESMIQMNLSGFPTTASTLTIKQESTTWRVTIKGSYTCQYSASEFSGSSTRTGTFTFDDFTITAANPGANLSSTYHQIKSYTPDSGTGTAAGWYIKIAYKDIDLIRRA